MIRIGVAYFLVASCLVGYAPISQSGASADSKPVSAKSDVPRKNETITFMELMHKIKDFTRSNKIILEDASSKEMSTVGGRITVGFQQDPPAKIQLADGITILWGWKHQEAFFKSIAIFDSHNTLKMAGFANDLPLIYSRSVAFGDTVITNSADYEALLERSSRYSSPPIVQLYAATQEDADTYYPLAARWVQASMMGFNTKCSEPKLSASCRFVETIQIPTYIYTRDCPYRNESNPKCRLHLPSAVSNAVPSLDDFR